ncbi:MAG: DUF4231 domain-containing protein [Bacteroidetes bacterium]|nr:DUF4231 domain-containing protein [Bacteroidota bacterium]MBP7398864.1 DUF4231 domain-containing protein [Chitinophagales bacterium]MBK7109487.1 DUF4231 domain-containing protein [Bacteroidota bacterium]MBK8487775.1 DUF4231 domain-containing protein [Bacteroidota bacterium]MBK8682470.1 DUF4231 domain-containing protein [Bacteroidota bacterium]
MDEAQYLEQRIDNQIKWHSSKSRQYKKAFQSLQLAQIFLGISIPFCSILIKDPLVLKIVVGALGMLIALIAGLIALFKFQENWVNNRRTSEFLKNEKYLFLTKATPYDGQNAFSDFVVRSEQIMMDENQSWVKSNSGIGEK